MKINKITYIFLFVFLILNITIYAENEIPINVINDIKNIYTKHGFNSESIFPNYKPIISSKSLQKNILDITPKKPKSATLLIRDLNRYVAKHDTNLKRILKNKLKLYRPDDSTDEDFYGINSVKLLKTYKTTHYMLHYIATEGNSHSVPLQNNNGNSVPDLIENFGIYFEECWTTLNNLGFIEPKKDSDGLMDIYFVNISTSGVAAYAATDNDSDLQVSGYIVIDNDYVQHDYSHKITNLNLEIYVKAYFSHEFFHLVEFSYNSYCDNWIAEACSTWIEDIIANELNDYYSFLPMFFNNPNFSLEYFSSDLSSNDSDFSYGACVFPRYLHKKYGIEVLTRMWEYMRDNGETNMDGMAKIALKNTLPEKGLTLDSVFGDFEVACYFVDLNYNDDFANKYYKDEEFRNIANKENDFAISRKIFTTIAYPFDNYNETTNLPYGLGAYYFLIIPQENTYSMQLRFKGDAKAGMWGGRIIKFKKDYSIEVDNFNFIDKNNAYIKIDNFSDLYSKVILIPYVSEGNKYIQYNFSLTNVDFIAPSTITNFSIKTNNDSNAELSWDNPTDDDFAGVVILKNDSTQVSDIFDTTTNTIVYRGKASTYINNKLVGNKTYYFKVFAYDYTLNYSIGVGNKILALNTISPSPITQLKAIPGGSEGKIKLDWSSYPAPKDLAYYKIYTFNGSQKTADVKNIKIYDSTIENFYYKSELVNNNSYYFAVTAVDINSNEDTNVLPVKAVPQEYNSFSLQLNVSDMNIYIDGNYAYAGKYLNTTYNGVKLDFKEIAKKHFLSLQSKNGTYLDYYQTFDLTTNFPTLNIKLSSSQATEYSSPEILIPQFNGKLTSPFVVDWNNDEKKDLLLGNESGEIFIYLNTNTDASPVLGNPIPVNIGNVPINVGTEAVPFVVDWNNDSQKDLLIGNKDGKIYLFENIGSDDSPVFSDSTIIFSYNKSITPYVIDLNLDRKKDIVFGCKNGTINYLLNINTDENPKLSSTPGEISNISVENYSAPFFANWDNKNQIDLLIGSENIGMQIYYNAETKKLSNFTVPSTTAPFIPSNKSRIKPFIVDWNNDGLLDVIIGEENGNISIYYGKKTNPVTPSGSSKKKICIISKSINNINNLTKTRDEILLNSFSGKIITNLYYKINTYITNN